MMRRHTCSPALAIIAFGVGILLGALLPVGFIMLLLAVAAVIFFCCASFC